MAARRHHRRRRRSAACTATTPTTPTTTSASSTVTMTRRRSISRTSSRRALSTMPTTMAARPHARRATRGTFARLQPARRALRNERPRRPSVAGRCLRLGRCASSRASCCVTSSSRWHRRPTRCSAQTRASSTCSHRCTFSATCTGTTRICSSSRTRCGRWASTCRQRASCSLATLSIAARTRSRRSRTCWRSRYAATPARASCHSLTHSLLAR